MITLYVNKKRDIVLKEEEYKNMVLKDAKTRWGEMDEDHRENYGNKFERFLYMVESRYEGWDSGWKSICIEPERYKEAEDLSVLWCFALNIDYDMDEDWERMVNEKRIIARLTKSWYVVLEFEVIDETERVQFAEIKYKGFKIFKKDN